MNVLPSLQKACHYYQLAADQGHPEAQLQLGILFEEGLGIAQSEEMAFLYYQRAADQNNPFAFARLGLCYEKGIGTKLSSDESVRCYRVAAEQGSIVGLYYLAKAYEMGKGVEKSIEQATIYYKKRFDLIQAAADAGDVQMQILMALSFKHGTGVVPSPEAAVYYFKLAADNNDSFAQDYLGYCYEEGNGVVASGEKALYYYKLAADQGNPSAQLSLGGLLQSYHRESEAFHYFMLVVHNSLSCFRSEGQYYVADCFERGCGVQQSAQEALYYYQLAATAGHSEAKYRLAKAYSSGQLGLQQCYEKGLHYYTLAADNGNVTALKELAIIYLEGIGVEKSLKKANDLLKKRFSILEEKAKEREPLSQTLLGLCFESGMGVEQSFEKAFHYYKLAADQNSPPGQFYLSECYHYGKGTEVALDKALHYYKLAADQGHIVAQNELALLLYKEKMYREAFFYFKLAAENDFEACGLQSESQYYLGKLFEEGKGVIASQNTALSYYQLAADEGSPDAQMRMGDIYLKGELGVEISYTRALNFYQLAAEKRHAPALIALGHCFENGLGVEKSLAQACVYYKQASDLKQTNSS